MWLYRYSPAIRSLSCARSVRNKPNPWSVSRACTVFVTRVSRRYHGQLITVCKSRPCDCLVGSERFGRYFHGSLCIQGRCIIEPSIKIHLHLKGNLTLSGNDVKIGHLRSFTGVASFWITFAVGLITWTCTVVASTLLAILVYHRIAIASGEPVAAYKQYQIGQMYILLHENFTVAGAIAPILACSFTHEAYTFRVSVTWSSMSAEQCSFGHQVILVRMR